MLRTLEVWGSPAERGRRHGQVLGDDIRLLRRGLLLYLARISLYAGALPMFGLLKWVARGFWPHIPPPLREEMAGVAAGADLGLGSLLLINVLDDLANNSPRCSALAVGEGRTTSGAYLMGRNLDYPLFTEYLSQLQTLFIMEPHRAQPLASLAWPGFVGVCTGMNYSGVALAQLSSMSRDRSLKGTPAALRFRLALETGDTVSAVAANVLKYPGTIGNNLMLCGPREALVLELSARRGVVRHPHHGLLTVTNHFQTPVMEEFKGRFPLRPPFSVLSSYHFSEAYSQGRNLRLQQLARDRQLGQEDLQTILADAKVANAGTAVCAIFSPADRLLWVAQGETPPVNQGPFVAVQLWD
ncbi:MAG: C45 family autoproteolytic acyltransferase/hydrolase [Thermodesulfobacteriota bacterium]